MIAPGKKLWIVCFQITACIVSSRPRCCGRQSRNGEVIVNQWPTFDRTSGRWRRWVTKSVWVWERLKDNWSQNWVVHVEYSSFNCPFVEKTLQTSTNGRFFHHSNESIGFLFFNPNFVEYLSTMSDMGKPDFDIKFSLRYRSKACFLFDISANQIQRWIQSWFGKSVTDHQIFAEYICLFDVALDFCPYLSLFSFCRGMFDNIGIFGGQNSSSCCNSAQIFHDLRS